MLCFGDLNSLSILMDLGEREQAKKLASRMLANAETSELWTIARCAAILDSSAPHIAQTKLSAFGDALTDEHRRQLVTFCAVHTGQRTRRTSTIANPAYPLFGLSIYYDTRPGYDERDAQPAGLSVYPTPWETRQARTKTALTRQLRDDLWQLPREVRASLRIVDTATRADVRHAPLTRTQQRRALRRRRMERLADDYMRTRLGVEDRTMPDMRTIFDVDDDAPALTEQPDGYALDYDRAALIPLRVTPCVSCFIERRPQDASRNRHDDGLCGECRDDQRPGLPAIPAPRTARGVGTVAYLNPAARAHAARATEITAPCAAVAACRPRAAALVWIRAHYRRATEQERVIIAQWVTAWLDTDRPQPPTTPAPAAPIQPALAAA